MKNLTKLYLVLLVAMIALLPITLIAQSEPAEKAAKEDLQISQVNEPIANVKNIETVSIVKQPEIKIEYFCAPIASVSSLNIDIANYSALLDYYAQGQSQEQLGFSVLYPGQQLVKKEKSEEKSSEVEGSKRDSRAARSR